jgi:hypothetical protein
MTITWHTADDDRVCPICLPLDEYTWTYDTERDALPTYLHHPQLGIIVWDVQADEPRPHGHHRLNCRCTLEVTFNVEEIYKAIHDKLTWAIQTKALPPGGMV